MTCIGEKMFTIIKSFADLIPELRDSPPEQAQAMYWRYYFKSFKHFELWLGFMGLAGCISLWDRCVTFLSNNISSKWMPVLEVLLLVIFTVFGMYINTFAKFTF